MHRIHPAPAFNAKRLTAIGVIVLVHVLLALGWQRPQRMVQADARSTTFVWIDLPPLPRAAPAVPEQARDEPQRPAVQRETSPALRPNPGAITRPDAAAAPVETAIAPADQPAVSATPTAETILERARRDAGTIDRALRKENNAVIVAPPNSPQLRMKQGMEEAAELAPNAVWQAPKMAGLVNQTADGARRTRVVSGGGTYCITERSPITAIETIERHGRTRITNCPQHETPARKQLWKSARD